MHVILFLIAIVIFFVYKLNAHKIKGAIGESRVAWQLNKLDNEQFMVFNNVLIRTGNGSSQIDHVVISVYGIFVIETKNYSGWIHGNEHSEYWTQSIYKKKTNFRNPITQNWAHIYALKEVLSDFKQVTYHPIVVFAGRAELKNVYSNIPVIYEHEVFQTIMNKVGIPNLSIMQVNNIADKLNEIIIQSEVDKREHVNHVQDYAYERKRKENLLICPRCNGELAVREGRYGKFYGCSNYPTCRYTLKY